MAREDVMYGIGGIVLGLVLGFLVANWTRAGTRANVTAPKTSDSGAASVNSGRQTQLPPGHPDVGEGKRAAAQELPAGHPDIGSGQQAASGPLELPSLDPLPPSSREKRTEQEYKNVQVLKGLPAERLMNVMFAFKAALGVDCTHCHIKDQWEKDDKQAKQIARKMIKMTRDINSQYVGGMGRVTCFTCHRGQVRPAS